MQKINKKTTKLWEKEHKWKGAFKCPLSSTNRRGRKGARTPKNSTKGSKNLVVETLRLPWRLLVGDDVKERWIKVYLKREKQKLGRIKKNGRKKSRGEICEDNHPKSREQIRERSHLEVVRSWQRPREGQWGCSLSHDDDTFFLNLNVFLWAVALMLASQTSTSLWRSEY